MGEPLIELRGYDNLPKIKSVLQVIDRVQFVEGRFPVCNDVANEGINVSEIHVTAFWLKLAKKSELSPFPKKLTLYSNCAHSSRASVSQSGTWLSTRARVVSRSGVP